MPTKNNNILHKDKKQKNINHYKLGDDVRLNLVFKKDPKEEKNDHPFLEYADANLITALDHPLDDAYNIFLTGSLKDASFNNLDNEVYNEIIYHILNRLTSGYLNVANFSSFNTKDWFGIDLENKESKNKYDFLIIKKHNKKELNKQAKKLKKEQETQQQQVPQQVQQNKEQTDLQNTFDYTNPPSFILPNKTYTLIFLASINKKMLQNAYSLDVNTYRNSNEIYLSPNALLSILARNSMYAINQNKNIPLTFDEILQWVKNYEYRLYVLKNRLENKITKDTKGDYYESSDGGRGIKRNDRNEIETKQDKKQEKDTQKDKELDKESDKKEKNEDIAFNNDDYAKNRNIDVNENNDPYYLNQESDTLLDLFDAQLEELNDELKELNSEQEKEEIKEEVKEETKPKHR